jgi:hypothetical protein
MLIYQYVCQMIGVHQSICQVVCKPVSLCLNDCCGNAQVPLQEIRFIVIKVYFYFVGVKLFASGME